MLLLSPDPLKTKVDVLALRVRLALAVRTSTVPLATAFIVQVPVPILTVCTPVAPSVQPFESVRLKASVELQSVPVYALVVSAAIDRVPEQVTVPPPELPSNVAESAEPG